MRVSVVHSVTILSHQAAVVGVQCDSNCSLCGPLLLDPDTQPLLQVENTLLEPTKNGMSQVVLPNTTDCSCSVESGAEIGQATSVDVVSLEEEPAASSEQEIVSTPLTLQSGGLIEPRQMSADRSSRATLVNWIC